MTHTLAAPHPQQPTSRAAAPGSPPRVDLYTPIHKALRSAMGDTLMRVGRLDVTDAKEFLHTLAQCDALLALCEGHVHHENDFMHPAIEARQPLGSQRIAAEHEEHLAHIADLRGEVKSLRAASADTRATLALRLYRHLALFVAANFQHMHIEETAHNAVLWAHYSDAELRQLHGRLMAAIKPSEHLEVARWLVPALTPAERAVVVAGMQAEAPPQAFLVMLAGIRPHLDDLAWNKLSRAIGIEQPPGFVQGA